MFITLLIFENLEIFSFNTQKILQWLPENGSMRIFLWTIDDIINKKKKNYSFLDTLRIWNASSIRTWWKKFIENQIIVNIGRELNLLRTFFLRNLSFWQKFHWEKCLPTPNYLVFVSFINLFKKFKEHIRWISNMHVTQTKYSIYFPFSNVISFFNV